MWTIETLTAAGVRGGGALPTLIEICVNLHASNDGTGDPLPDGEEYSALEALRRRLRMWRDPTDEYDSAVRLLCAATVRETEAVQARRDESVRREESDRPAPRPPRES